MKRSFVRVAPAVVVVSLVLAACGGSAQEPKSPSDRAPESAGTPSQQSQVQPGYPPPPPPPPLPPIQPSQPGQPQAGQFAQPPGQDGSAWVEFQGAKGIFDATTSDCAVACKALASIDRATGHVCAIVPDADHCATAKETLKSARRKVRAECTVCPSGASTDPDGPIPSVPAAP